MHGFQGDMEAGGPLEKEAEEGTPSPEGLIPRWQYVTSAETYSGDGRGVTTRRAPLLHTIHTHTHRTKPTMGPRGHTHRQVGSHEPSVALAAAPKNVHPTLPRRSPYRWLSYMTSTVSYPMVWLKRL